jgi:outer membrane protein
MTFLRVVLSILIALVIFIPNVSSAIGIEAAVGAWQVKPGGDFGYKGDNLNLVNDLGYGKNTKLTARVKVDMPLIIPNVYLAATPMEFSGSGIKNVTFKFANQNYKFGVPFTSKISLNHYDVGLYYGVPFLHIVSLGNFNVDAGVNLRFVDLKARVDQENPIISLHETKNRMLPIPMIYVGVQVTPFKHFSLEADAMGISYNSNSYFDYAARAKFKIFGPVFIDAGYRYEKVKLDTSDIKAAISFKGPFAELGVQF